MKYDPVKNRLGQFFNRTTWLRKLFYLLLDILLLRTWHVRRAIRKFAVSHTGERVILDAGSGFGQYTWRMTRMNPKWSIDAVDIKQEQLDDCSAFFSRACPGRKVTFSYADLTGYSAENRYDMILSVDVMEHIEEDRQVFANFHNSLKDDGWLIISTPSDRGGSGVNHDHQESFIDEHVRDGYPVGEIKEKLEDAGFSKITTGYTYGLPGRISWVLSRDTGTDGQPLFPGRNNSARLVYHSNAVCAYPEHAGSDHQTQ